MTRVLFMMLESSRTMTLMLHYFLDLLFPRTSLTGEEGTFITMSELRSLHAFPVRMEAIELKKVGVRYLDRLVAASTYESSPLLRLAIRRFKYTRIPALKTELGGLLLRASERLIIQPGTVLCPVPLHWTRRFARGFNQSELLADELRVARGWNVVCLLRRVRPTGHQAWRTRKERLGAMHNAFVAREVSMPSHVVLIDDIATTGVTLDACARVLKKAGVKHVQALVIAKG